MLDKNMIENVNIEAQEDFLKKHGEPLYCGFAWVEVPVARVNSKEAKKLINLGFKKSWVRKRMDLWIHSFSQSMDIKIAGAQAVVELLKENGIQASYGCRAD
jgi:hypothetical protein|tara:strand:- start:491 stop:796 length:306 start_codon:yes stop_codon:yes gene_type:complete